MGHGVHVISHTAVTRLGDSSFIRVLQSTVYHTHHIPISQDTNNYSQCAETAKVC